MRTVQAKLNEDYHDKMVNLCTRFGVTKADLLRFMLDTLEHWGVTDDEFDRWYDNQKSS